MIRRLLQRYRTWRYIKSQQNKVFQEGTLLNAFYKTKTIFIHIPKTAGVSLLKAVYGDVSLEGHRSFYFNKIALKIKNEQYFSFAFVRNPFDRLHSTYLYLRKGGQNHHDRLVFETHLSEFKGFEDFVVNGLDKKLISQITHLIPQYEYLCDNRGNVLVDFVGRFENLEHDVALLSKKLRKNIRLGHHNYNAKNKGYKEIYTDEMIEKVSRLYQKDIDIFGYSFNKSS